MGMFSLNGVVILLHSCCILQIIQQHCFMSNMLELCLIMAKEDDHMVETTCVIISLNLFLVCVFVFFKCLFVFTN